MAQFFEDEKKYPDNRSRANFVFLGYPHKPPLPLDDYRSVVKKLEAKYPVRLWYFLDEITTQEMMRKIWRAILRADFAVFDVSGGNPNVAFELGLALAIGRSCMTVLKTGAPNPLGSADLGYAERAEYTSAATLEDTLAKLIEAKSSAAKTWKEASLLVYDSNLSITRDELQDSLRKLLHIVYTNKKLTKSGAEKILGDRKLADVVLNKLRELGVLQVIGVKRAARWVFTDDWVHHDHEVVGT